MQVQDLNAMQRQDINREGTYHVLSLYFDSYTVQDVILVRAQAFVSHVDNYSKITTRLRGCEQGLQCVRSQSKNVKMHNVHSHISLLVRVRVSFQERALCRSSSSANAQGVLPKRSLGQLCRQRLLLGRDRAQFHAFIWFKRDLINEIMDFILPSKAWMLTFNMWMHHIRS
jgi:hypothetical protein